VLHVDFWCDGRRLPAGTGSTVEALAERFPAAVMQLLGEALEGDPDSDDDEAEDEALTLVELSAAVFDDDE
jgi:phthiocerol/phenolphthiocerol synthesis type-I polyketide synthase E